MLFSDRLILGVDTPELFDAISLIREFRFCTTTVKIGPILFLSSGSFGLRSIAESGVTDIILDARLCGSPQEVFQMVTEAAKLPNVKAITCNFFPYKELLKAAKKANQAENPIKILTVTVPTCVTDVKFREVGCSETRVRHINRAVKTTIDCGTDGIVLDYADLLVAKLRGVEAVTSVKRYPLSTLRDSYPASYCKLPGLAEVFAAGAEHAVLESSLLQNCDVESIAECAHKEIQQLFPVKSSRKLC